MIMPVRLGFDLDSKAMAFVRPLLEPYDTVIDVLFLIDIILCFRTTYLDRDGNHVTVPHMIAWKYLTTWFPVDFVSWVPLDRIIGGQVRSLVLVRTLRLVRLAKLMRLKRLKGFSPTALELHTSLVRCVKLMAKLIFVAHMFGCFFAYVATVSCDPDDDATCDVSEVWWVQDLFSMFPEEDFAGVQTDVGSRYVGALYWAFTTMTTVGYGDILPMNDGERLYCSIIMVLGATVFGYIVGSVSAIASNPNSAAAREGVVLTHVLRHMDQLHVSARTKQYVRSTVNFILAQKSAFDEEAILKDLPVDL